MDRVSHLLPLYAFIVWRIDKGTTSTLPLYIGLYMRDKLNLSCVWELCRPKSIWT